MKAKKRLFPVICVIIMLSFVRCISSEKVEVREQGENVTIGNNLLKIVFNLKTGTYCAFDKKIDKACITDAYFMAIAGEQIHSNQPASIKKWQQKEIVDELGEGKTLFITCTLDKKPSIVLQITVYQNKPFVIFNGGIDNQTISAVKMSGFYPLQGIVFKDFEGINNFQMLDGNGGGIKGMMFDYPIRAGISMAGLMIHMLQRHQPIGIFLNWLMKASEAVVSFMSRIYREAQS